MLNVLAIVNGAEQANPRAVVIAQDMFSVEQHMSLMPVMVQRDTQSQPRGLLTPMGGCAR